MKYNIGDKFYKVRKDYSRVQREYKTDENGERWYREKPQKYKLVVDEYEIISHKQVIYTGDITVWGDIDQYAVSLMFNDGSSQLFYVEDDWFEEENLFSSKLDAEKYINKVPLV
jgi:hypothetical protein